MVDRTKIEDVEDIASAIDSHRKPLRSRLQPAFDQIRVDMLSHDFQPVEEPTLSPEFRALFAVLIEQEARIRETEDELRRLRCTIRERAYPAEN